MKLPKFTLMCLAVSLVYSQSALSALMITPTSSFLINTGTDGIPPDSTNAANPESALLSVYGGSILYKSDVGSNNSSIEGSEPFADSYATTYNGDLSGGTISYTGGSFITGYSPVHLLVKNGITDPIWYFFDLSAANWNGTDTLDMSGFWPQRGSISHVTIMGTPGTNKVPDGGTSVALLGMALLGLGGVHKVLGKRQ